MVKIKRRDTERARNAIISLESAKAKSSSYNTPEVNDALQEMFHKKCYLCENKEITSFQIDHLHPHRGDDNLKYSWDNLFLACAHCNNTKLDKYDPILDCTQENVDQAIAFRKKGYFGTNEDLVFEALDHREETANTVGLLYEVYYGSTPQKKMESVILRKGLRKDLSAFKEYIREYQETENEDDREDLKCLIKQNMEARTPFAAFKRWLIWDHRDRYEDIALWLEKLMLE